jgi:hypothetical protein
MVHRAHLPAGPADRRRPQLFCPRLTCVVLIDGHGPPLIDPCGAPIRQSSSQSQTDTIDGENGMGIEGAELDVAE